MPKEWKRRKEGLFHEGLDELQSGAGGKGVEVFDTAHALLDLGEDDSLLGGTAKTRNGLDKVADKLKV